MIQSCRSRRKCHHHPVRKVPSTPESSGHCAGRCGPGAGPSPSPPPVASLAQQRLSQGGSHRRDQQVAWREMQPSSKARPTTPGPPKSVLAGHRRPSGAAATTTTVSPTLATCSGTGSEVRAAASLARRTLPGDGVPERPRTARASCRLGSSASLAVLASTYSRDAGDTGLPAHRGTHFSWNWRNPGLTWGLAFSREVVAKGEVGR